jgi:hypothetical protein
MATVENERVADFVMGDGIKVVGLMAEIAGGEPVVVVGQKEPA